jgi:hypothetical protein
MSALSGSANGPRPSPGGAASRRVSGRSRISRASRRHVELQARRRAQDHDIQEAPDQQPENEHGGRKDRRVGEQPAQVRHTASDDSGELEDGQVHGDNQTAYHAANHDHDKWLQQTAERIDGVIDLALIELSNFE